MDHRSPLPTELWIAILQQLSSNEKGLRTLLFCSLTSRLLYGATLSPSLWKPYYDIRYRLFDEANERFRRSRLGDDWRALYLERRRLDQEALKLLTSIACATDHRVRAEIGEKLVKGFGLDLWESFTIKLSLPNPVLFQDDSDVEKIMAGMPILDLSSRFWISEILGVIARRRTMEIWGAIMKPSLAGNTGIDAPFEEAFSCLSSFWNVHPLEIIRKLDELASRCREYLCREQIVHELGRDDMDVSKLCTSITMFMREEGYHGAEDGHFYHIFNSFPNFFLFSRKGTLPISLAFIFVSLAKRLGMRAFPVSTPSRVVVWMEGTFVDTFVAPDYAILATSDERPDESTYQQIESHMAKEMLGRVGRNIMTARDIAGDAHATYDKMARATYAADCVRALYEVPIDESHLLKFAGLGMQHPLDMSLVIRDKLVPILSSGAAERVIEDSMRILDNAEKKAIPSIRNYPWGRHEHLRARFAPFFVGQIVLENKGALACVIGWTVTVEDTSTMSTTAGDNIQTWYKILSFCEYGSREANVCKDVLPEQIIPYEGRFATNLSSLLVQNLLGFYFKDAERYEEPDSGLERYRFLMNDMMRQLFPGDDEYGSRWVRSGQLGHCSEYKPMGNTKCL